MVPSKHEAYHSEGFGRYVIHLTYRPTLMNKQPDKTKDGRRTFGAADAIAKIKYGKGFRSRYANFIIILQPRR